MPDTIPPLRVLDDQPIHTDLKMCDGLFCKIMTFAAGSFIPQHSHDTAHLSVIATGAVRAWKDGVFLGEFRAPTGITIEAHAKHMFEAIETNTLILCVHRVDDGDEPHVHEQHEVETI
jgi:quercetin dioxygenase-like cupin family protein